MSNVTKRPNFVGIGVPRGGTTWLHEFVNIHPHAYTPRARKEVHYFDRHYDRGDDWYTRFFADASDEHRAMGEFTPHYLYSAVCAERIRSFGIKCVVSTIRDPVERTWSNYLYKKRQDLYRGDLRQFLVDYPEMVAWSSYVDHLGPWIDTFGEGFCILVYEVISKDHTHLRNRLGAALDLEPELFASDVGERRVNASLIPKRKHLFKKMIRFNQWLLSKDLDVVASSLKRVPGAMSFLRSPANTDISQMQPSELELEYLAEVFAPSVHRLQGMIDVDLSMWKCAN